MQGPATTLPARGMGEIKGVRPLCLFLGGNEPAGGRVGGWLSPV
jgi:hypothetical protein